MFADEAEYPLPSVFFLYPSCEAYKFVTGFSSSFPVL